MVVRIDGKIAAISTDYKALAAISARLVQQKSPVYRKITAETVGFDEVWDIRNKAEWSDMTLFGTDFQKKVWRQLWELTHPGQTETGLTHSGATIAAKESAEATEEETSAAKGGAEAGRRGQRLISYSDFADLCQNRAGVRAVAHAIGLNPISVVIPCHLVIPKESFDRIMEIKKKAEKNSSLESLEKLLTDKRKN